MQIITLEDFEFPDLMSAFRAGRQVGRYWRNGRIQLVCATPQFLLVSSHEAQNKIAIKPARSIGEAESLALQLLKREEERGNQIQVEPSYQKLG